MIRKNKNFINIMPLQTGSILNDDAVNALIEYSDGYAICDYCNGSLEKIQNPPLANLIFETLPKFLGCDKVRLTTGAREGKFIVFNALTQPGDTIVVDANRHYSTYLAAERLGLKIVEVPNSGYPEYKIDVNDYIPLIKQYRPALVLLTYPDGNYGNLSNAKLLGKITCDYNIPYMINGAYAVGRFPVNLEDIGADFVVASAHKSMGASGPLGVLGIKKKWEDIIFKKSSKYTEKEIEFLGCTARGPAIVTLVASMPYIIKRVQKWNIQVEKAQWFSSQMEKLGMIQLGEKKHQHDLITFETPIIHEISKSRREKGYFLHKELRKRQIWGVKPGQTKKIKISTFAASKNELEIVLEAFKNIICNI